MAWKSSFGLQLLLPYLATLAAVAVSLHVYSRGVVERRHLETLSATTLRQAELVGQLLPWGVRGVALDRDAAELARQIDARITVITQDGVVLGDSDAPSTTLENHAQRPEVQAALLEGHGQASRKSASVGKRLFYQAWRQDRGSERRIVRLAVPMAIIDRVHGEMGTAIWVGIAVAAAASLWPALFLLQRLSRRVARVADYANAVARGENPAPLLPQGRDVIGKLEANLDGLASTLSRNLHAARDQQDKLEGVLGGMVEGVLVIDTHGIVLLSNRRAEEIFSLPPGESCIGQPLIAVTRHPDLHEFVRKVVHRGSFEPATVAEIHVNGARRQTLQVTVGPMPDAAGVVRAFILVCHDITDLKHLEQARSDFVANVSHELRTPLAAIRGYAETLRGGALEKDPENARRFLAIIERHAERLGRLVDDLLTLSDLELGRAELQRRPVRPESVIETACEILSDLAGQAGVELCRDVTKDLPSLDADPDRLVQMVVNLIDNAVKYTPSGGRVTVGARAIAADGDPSQVEISIADTGIGIPSDDLPRLTERFYRVDRARSRELGGTGLGLAIVKHIVQAHSGSLSIDSRLNHGTTVHVRLPTARAESP